MAKEIRKQDQESVEISLGRLAESAWRGVGAFFGLAVDLEKEGKSEYRKFGKVEGKTSSGKNIEGIYGVRVKVGLNPEEFKNQKKLDDGSDGSE